MRKKMNKLTIDLRVTIENVRSEEIQNIMVELLRAIYEGNETIIKKSSRSVYTDVTSLNWEKK